MPSSSSPSIWYDNPHTLIERTIHNIEKVILGKRGAVEKAVIAMLCGGHLLLEDVPGVGKTMLVRALACTLGCGFKRIQCTPDLLPADITGVSVYNQRTGDFEFRPGPVMTPIVLADELNRTSPRTQASLLEAMEEGRVTVDGVSYDLPRPFLLLATQNPIDFEGTYPLPEAQLDRFMMRISLGYPDAHSELQMLDRLSDKPPLDLLKPVMVPEEWLELQKEVALIHVDESIKRYIVALTAATRSHHDVLLGASPRASSALFKAAQAKALVEGRSYAIPDDVKSMAEAVLAHRLLLTGEARMSGRTAPAVVKAVLQSEPIPPASVPSAG